METRVLDTVVLQLCCMLYGCERELSSAWDRVAKNRQLYRLQLDRLGCFMTTTKIGFVKSSMLRDISK